jgi:hypothetical protein
MDRGLRESHWKPTSQIAGHNGEVYVGAILETSEVWIADKHRK